MSEAIKKRLPVIIMAVIFVVLVGVFVWKSNIKEGEMDWSTPSNLNLSQEEKNKYKESVNKLETNQQDVDALVSLARLRNWGGDPEGAIKLYRQALERRPTDTLILNNLADVYYSIGEYQQSEEMYLKILANNPKWTNAYRELINIYRYKIKEKYPSVPELIGQGLVVNSEAGEDFYALLGVYYEDIGETAKAIEAYRQVLKINPNNEGTKSALNNLETVSF